MWINGDVMLRVPCILMRGGTSRGPFFLASDLPQQITLRDNYLIRLMGSGNPLEIDGLGGGFPQTSKVAIVSPSSDQQADVDYLFAQVMINEKRVDTAPNCGNMLAAVGAFAIERHLVVTKSPVTCVRIHNLNTNTLIEAELQTPGGQLTYTGNTHIDGVPGTSAPVYLTFLNAVGSKTGHLFPTQEQTDVINGINVTCIDMAMPVVLIPANQLAKTARESPAMLDNDRKLMATIEKIRTIAGEKMGLGDVTNSVIPKPVLVGQACRQGTLTVRYFTPGRCHLALSTTGAIAIASACVYPNTIVQQFLPSNFCVKETNLIKLEHPEGFLDVKLTTIHQGMSNSLQASVIRTARKIFSGDVYIPSL